MTAETMMTLDEAMRARHGVHDYRPEPIAENTVAALRDYIDACNREGDLHMQLVLDEPQAFAALAGKVGGFSNVRNYIALIGPRSKHLDFDLGYWGQHVALYAQQLGLNSRWVAATYKKVPSAYEVRDGEKLVMVIALGYGAEQGEPHKSKPRSKVMRVAEGLDAPQWFLDGVDAALLAPTAMNQQAFTLELVAPDKVKRSPRVRLRREHRSGHRVLPVRDRRRHRQLPLGGRIGPSGSRTFRIRRIGGWATRRASSRWR
ncbi:hypothetical protein KIH75_05320 [Bifidobacterium sp. 64T4]|uniref:nitroreductase family protein n=1 Tax=Bifidobacterium pongonis TaxID=2834432 RepID=UPI001C56690A|nr:nitroreductase family protein [Bifidobacterium pongonis]MBW3094765.1 hypothetical protein [Bifidobacterium pongonis]